MPRRLPRFALTPLTAILTLAACSRAADPPKVPLAQSSASATAGQAASDLPPAAREALASGNSEFRAKHYETALAQYRLAAKAAPSDDATAYYGIYMAAKKLGNEKLADSAQAEVNRRAQSAAPMLTDSALRAVHATAGGKAP